MRLGHGRRRGSPPASLPPRLCVLGGHGKGEAPGKPTSTLRGQGTLAEDYLENGESGKSKRILTALGDNRQPLLIQDPERTDHWDSVQV